MTKRSTTLGLAEQTWTVSATTAASTNVCMIVSLSFVPLKPFLFKEDQGISFPLTWPLEQ